jgi:hypothetical protein
MFYVFFTNLPNKKLLARFSISNTSSKRPSKYGSGTPLPLFFGILSGEQPDSRSQVAAHQYNVDLSSQRARQVHESDFYHYDYIFAMDG